MLNFIMELIFHTTVELYGDEKNLGLSQSFKGLVNGIAIEFRNIVHQQALDYEGIPFMCGCCHNYGHLDLDCLLLKKKRQ